VDQAWAGTPGGLYLHDTGANVTLEHCTPDWDGDANCTLPSWQQFYKPLPGGGAAVLVINHGGQPLRGFAVEFAAVPGLACAGECAFEVADVWEQAQAGTHKHSYAVAALASHATVFVTLAPA
jgi:hypothetical protein